MARNTINKEQAVIVNNAAVINNVAKVCKEALTMEALAEKLGTKVEVLEAELAKATMTLVEHDYSVAKDKKRKEHILKDAYGGRITIRGHKESWMLISNKELEGWEKHARKTGTWWGKEVNKAAAIAFIAEKTGTKVELG